MVKKVKQKQKQKQKVKVSQNVKVIVGDVKAKRARKRTNVVGGKPSQLQKPSVSLNIINPYQQFLPNQPPPVPPSKSKLSEVNPSNVPPNILKSLGALGNQNTIIRNELRDLREFAQNQQATYNSLLLSQKEKETPENVSKPSKIDKMLKTKKMIMSSMNWENLIKSEPKKEEKIIQEEKKQPDIYQFLSPRPTGKTIDQRQVEGSILSGWLGQARENIAKEKKKKQELIEESRERNLYKKLYENQLGQQAEDLTNQAIMGAFQELEDEDEEDQSLMRDLYVSNLPQTISSGQLEQPSELQGQPLQSTFEGLMSESMELPEEEQPMTIRVKISKKKLEKQRQKELEREIKRETSETRKMTGEDIASSLMNLQEYMNKPSEETLREQLLAQKKAEEGTGAGAGAGEERGREKERGRGGRPKGSRNRPKEEIEQERLARQERGRGRPEMVFEPVKESSSSELLSRLRGKTEDDLRKLSVKQLDDYMRALGLSTREKGSTNPLPKENKVIAIWGMINLQKYKK